MIHFIVGSFLMSSAFSAPPVIHDYQTKIYHGDSAHPNLWAIEILPPAAHHFNLEAPRSAEQEKIKFDLVQETPGKILFQADQKAVHAGSVIEVSAFVCDEKKTYCMKKKMFVTLEDKNAAVITEKFSAKAEVAAIAKVPEKKKNSELFIDNDVARALAEAKTSQKPVLIDFYGIWCPPCNLYNEIIFSSKEFAEQAKKYVLLKLDVDAEKSFELKSRFKIGGYPTLLIAKVNEKGDWEEIERIVGYFPPAEFYPRLNQAYAHRNSTLEQRWKGRLEELLASELEQKNYDQIIALTEKSKEAKIQLYGWIAQAKKNAEFFKDSKNQAAAKETILSLAKDVQKQSSDTLVHAVDFLNDEFWLKQAEFHKVANDFLDQLSNRIDSKTMFVKGTELTAPDLDSLRMDLAETLNNNEELVKWRKQAIAHYEKLIRFFEGNGKRDLRSMNLEYAYLLWNDGRQEEAKKLYQKFIQKFPAEFTFYYAASKMYLTLKDYKNAREYSEKALQYSYGDNRIRAMDRLVAVMGEQGLKKEAILRGNEFLKSVKIPVGLNVRTGRYVDGLKKTIAKLSEPETKKI